MVTPFLHFFFFWGGGGGSWRGGGGVSCRTCCDHLLYPRLLSFFVCYWYHVQLVVIIYIIQCYSFLFGVLCTTCRDHLLNLCTFIFPRGRGGGGGGGKMNYLSRICSLIISFLFLRSNPHLQCVGPGVQPAHTWTSS